MAQAETNQVQLLVSEESTWAEVPSTPSMDVVRWTGGSLVHNKDTAESEILRADRMIDDIAEVMAHAEGDVNMEMSFGLASDDSPQEIGLLAEGALGSDIVQGGETAVQIAITASTGAVVGTGTDWSSHLVGQWIMFDGFSLGTGRGNNGPHQIATITDGQNLTLADTSILADEDTGAGNASWAVNCIRNGTTKKSYLLEMEFADVTEFVSFRGMRVNRFDMNITASQIATCTFNFMGQQGISSATGLDDPPTRTALGYSVLNATSNVGTIYEGGAASGDALATAIRSVSISIDNSGRNLPAVANEYAIGINYGRQRVTGTIEGYFEDNVLLEKYIQHTETSLIVPLNDAAGNWVIISIPSMYFTEGSPNVPGGDDEVIQTLNFAARREQTNSLYQVQIDFLPAF
jgi:hypothetical protein